MQIRLPDRTIEVFTITSRTTDANAYWREIQQCVDWSEAFDCTGVLLFTGNDTYVEPWLAAHAVCAQTRHLCPLVAVNPIYMHPFTTAKMISSLAYLYGRKTYLNMVTGTALSYLEAMNDHLSHRERYERLREYSHLVGTLLASPDPVSLIGQHYTVKNLRLLPRPPEALQPTFFYAGQSESAIEAAKGQDGVHVQMLPPRLHDGLTKGTRGIHFGIVTRECEAAAWENAHRIFPEDKRGQRILSLSMANTESVWKRRLKADADAAAAINQAYWLEPFRNFQADCPYYVGSHEQVAQLIAGLVLNGIRAFILDLPPRMEEFMHADQAFKKAEREILAPA